MTIQLLSAAPRGFDDAFLFGGDWIAFGQHWNAQPSPALRAGRVRFGWRPDALWLHAELDGHGATKAQRDGEDMWLLGDVLELFVAHADAPDYRELHITPNGYTLQLHFPDSNAVQVVHAKNEETGSHFYSADCGWRALAQNDADRWQVLASVPLALEAGAQLHLACGRYDYGSGEAIISNTAPLEKADFHRRADWLCAALSS